MSHFEFGEYAIYVWPAYGVSALTILGLVADSLWRAWRWRRAAEKLRGPTALDHAP